MASGKQFISFLLFLIVFQVNAGAPETPCSIRNSTTQDGEEVSYLVFYSLGGVFVNAGSASFTNQVEKFNGKTVYHITGSGRSHANYDWMYRVRDRYETFIDTASMLPLQFLRDVEEGKTKKKERIIFNRMEHTATSEKETVKVPPCIQDVLSSIYYARNIDFSQYKKGDKIPYIMFLDSEVHSLYIRYMGKETVRTKFGKFSAIRVKPLLVPGTIFSGGEQMDVWISDDRNRIPVRIESTILIGSIKVDMMAYKNLRYPLSSLDRKKAK